MKQFLILIIFFLFSCINIFSESSLTPRQFMGERIAPNQFSTNDSTDLILRYPPPNAVILPGQLENIEQKYINPSWFFDTNLTPTKYQEKFNKFKISTWKFEEELSSIRNLFVTEERRNLARTTHTKLSQKNDIELCKFSTAACFGIMMGYTIYYLTQPIDPTENKTVAQLTAILLASPFLWQSVMQFQKAQTTAALRMLYYNKIINGMNTTAD